MRTVCCVVVLLVACDGADPCGADALRAPPTGGGGNVVVVLLDDIGLDKVGGYGLHPQPAPTPVLDGLDAVGLRFDQAFTAPSCSPTRASILTGRRPHRTGIGTWINPLTTTPGLADDEITIPEAIAHAPSGPWTSSLVGKWHLSQFDGDARFDPLDQGFAHHRGTLGNIRMHDDDAEDRRWWDHWEKNTDGVLAITKTYATIDTTDEALGELATLPEPYFLMVSYNAAHSPWHVPPQSLHDLGTPTSDVDMMDAMVASVDREVGRLLAEIDLETTTVFVLSDNGTADQVVRPPWNAEYAKGSGYDASVHVPMWALGRAVSAVGRRTSALVHATDLFATVADLAGVDVGELDAEIDGVSLVPLLSEPDRPWRTCVISEQFPVNGRPGYQRTRSVRDGRYELVETPDGGRALIDLLDGTWGDQPDLLANGGVLDDRGAAAYEALDRALRGDR